MGSWILEKDCDVRLRFTAVSSTAFPLPEVLGFFLQRMKAKIPFHFFRRLYFKEFIAHTESTQ